MGLGAVGLLADLRKEIGRRRFARDVGDPFRDDHGIRRRRTEVEFAALPRAGKQRERNTSREHRGCHEGQFKRFHHSISHLLSVLYHTSPATFLSCFKSKEEFENNA